MKANEMKSVDMNVASEVVGGWDPIGSAKAGAVQGYNTGESLSGTCGGLVGGLMGAIGGFINGLFAA